MQRLTTVRLIVAVIALASLTAPALAQNPGIDYIGYAWETGGFFPSVIGDELFVAGVATGADPVFQIDFGIDELTFYMYGMTSGGETTLGSGTVMVNYTGGFLEIYRDPAQNADWGINPPSAVSPATFSDGTLAFRGSFTSLTFYFTADGNGAYEGALNGLDGEVIDDVCSNCAYTWGGSFLLDAGAQIPDGYDMQLDGILELDGAVSNDISTWGGVKALYGN